MAGGRTRRSPFLRRHRPRSRAALVLHRHALLRYLESQASPARPERWASISRAERFFSATSMARLSATGCRGRIGPDPILPCAKLVPGSVGCTTSPRPSLRLPPTHPGSPGRRRRPGLAIGHHDVAPVERGLAGRRVGGFLSTGTRQARPRGSLDLALRPRCSGYRCSWPTWHPTRASPPPRTVPRRLHLLLDSYGYDADRPEFGALVAGRARMNAAGIRRLAGTDPVYASLQSMAATYERAAEGRQVAPAVRSSTSAVPR